MDEVAAQHVDADAIVHYGHACLSQLSALCNAHFSSCHTHFAFRRTARLPVVYIFGKKHLDVDKMVEGLVGLYLLHHPEAEDSAVVLRHDVVYNHLAGSTFPVLISHRQSHLETPLEALQSKFTDTMKPHAIKVHYTPIPTYAGPAKAASPPPSIGNTTTTNTPPTSSNPLPNLDASPIFYIGGESLSLTNLLMTHASCEVRLFPHHFFFHEIHHPLSSPSLALTLTLTPCTNRSTSMTPNNHHGQAPTRASNPQKPTDS